MRPASFEHLGFIIYFNSYILKKLVWLSLLSILWSACHYFDKQVTINAKSTVTYNGTVSQKEAKRLGQFLLERGYFNTFDKRTVSLHKENQLLVVTFFMNRELFTADQENIVAGFQVWYQWIKDEVFPNAAIRVVLADTQKQTLHTIDRTLPSQRSTSFHKTPPCYFVSKH